MAVAGDVMIKAIFDVAEIKTGVDKANQQLDEFGRKAEATSKTVTSALEAISTVMKALAVKELIEKFIDWTSEVQKNVASITDLAKSYNMSTDSVQAYSRAAADAGVSQNAFLGIIQNFNHAVDQAVAGNARAIDAFKGIGVHVLDASGKQRDYNKLLEEASGKLLNMGPSAAKTRAELVLFQQTGQQLTDTLKETQKPVDELIQKYSDLGLIHGPNVIKMMKDLEDRSEKAGKALEVFFAPIIAAVKTAVLESIATGIQNVAKIISAIDFSNWYKVAALLAAFANPASAGALLSQIFGNADFGKTVAAGMTQDTSDSIKKSLDYTQGQVTELERQLTKGMNVGKQLEEQYRLLDQLRNKYVANQLAQGGGSTDGYTRPLPDVPPPDATDPAIHRIPRGGGGGTGINRTQELLDRLVLQTAAARKATADMLSQAQQGMDLKTIEEGVERQKKVDDLVAKIESSAKARGMNKSQITAIAEAFVGSEEEFNKTKQYLNQAEETEKRLGDGMKTRDAALVQLNKEYATGTLSLGAYNQALHNITEAYKDQQDESKRLQNDFESLEAGIDKAARAWLKSNDMFSMGGQLFSGFVDTMSKGFEDLAFNAGKSFNQILTDFGKMLAEMAFKMAMYKMLSWAFNAMGLGGLASAGQPGSPFFGPSVPMQSGGSVYPGMDYLVGETGPERFTPDVAGKITPMGSSMGQSGDISINVDMGNQGSSISTNQAVEFSRKLKKAVVDTITDQQRPGGALYRRQTA